MAHPLPQVAAIALYVHVAIFAGTLLAGLWSLVNEGFDPHSAKRGIGHIAMGGTVGGIAGGLAGIAFGRWLGPAAMLLPLAASNVLAIPLVLLVGRRIARVARRPAQTAPSRSGLAVLREVPYLRLLALLTLLVAVGSALLDYVLSSSVAHSIPRGPGLVTFFALFHTGVGVSAFVLQAALTRPALERLGLAGTVVLLPLSVLGCVAVAWWDGGLWSAVLLRAMDATMSASLYRAAYELLYTPVPPHQKRPSKVLVDVAVDRIGTAAGSALVVLVLLVPQPRPVLLLLAAGCALAVLATAWWTHRAYVAALAGSLRNGVVLLRSSDVLDATTRRTLANSGALNRSELLRRIEALQTKAELPSIAPPADPQPDDGDVIPESSAVGFMAAPRSLRWDHPVETADDLIERLADDASSRDALSALRGVARSSLDTLAAALVDTKRGVVIRRRLPRVLEIVDDERAVHALVEGLFAPELEVRQQCCLALLELTERHPELPVPADRVEEAAMRDVLLGRDALAGLTHVSTDLRARVDRGIEHVLLTMSVVLDREPVQIALRALFGRDPGLRGTALEYLHNVLPRPMLESGMFMLEATTPRRPKSELARELLRSRDG